MFDVGLLYQKWHQLPLKQDFKQTIAKIGELPISNYKKKLRNAEENNQAPSEPNGQGKTQLMTEL